MQTEMEQLVFGAQYKRRNAGNLSFRGSLPKTIHIDPKWPGWTLEHPMDLAAAYERRRHLFSKSELVIVRETPFPSVSMLLLQPVTQSAEEFFDFADIFLSN